MFLLTRYLQKILNDKWHFKETHFFVNGIIVSVSKSKGGDARAS